MLLSESQLLNLAEKVVNRYVSKGIIPLREKEDTQMLIVEKFLMKQNSITQNFSGKASITTYCISVLNNMCCEVIRKELKHWKNQIDDVPEEKEYNAYATSKNTIIQDEITYLHKIFNIYGPQKSKIRLALNYYYCIDIFKDDLMQYTKGYKKEYLKLESEENQKKSNILNNLAIFVSSVENKNTKPDAIRMWLNKTITSIVERLNSPFNRASYDKESFKVLYEFYNTYRQQKS